MHTDTCQNTHLNLSIKGISPTLILNIQIAEIKPIVFSTTKVYINIIIHQRIHQKGSTAKSKTKLTSYWFLTLKTMKKKTCYFPYEQWFHVIKKDFYKTTCLRIYWFSQRFQSTVRNKRISYHHSRQAVKPRSSLYCKIKLFTISILPHLVVGCSLTIKLLFMT